MPNISRTLPLQNEMPLPLRLYLEPVPEEYVIYPGQKVLVHAVFDDQTNNIEFTVAPHDLGLTVYCPGEISGWVDSFVTCEGVRLKHEVE
jgi:hypothetical protein